MSNLYKNLVTVSNLYKNRGTVSTLYKNRGTVSTLFMNRGTVTIFCYELGNNEYFILGKDPARRGVPIELESHDSRAGITMEPWVLNDSILLHVAVNINTFQ